MASNPDRQLTVKIQRNDMIVLSQNQFQLQVAKAVVTKGKPVFNLVWQSTILGPLINVRWKPVYAFNWSEDVLENGISLTVGGSWEKCSIGQVLDIDAQGMFVPSTATPDPQAMKIGKNGLKALNGQGIRIVIGMQNSWGSYDPIFIDPVALNLNMSATFKPLEQLQWWYESGSKQSTVFTDHESPFETGDFSTPDSVTGSFKKISEYDVQNGVWKTDASKCECKSMAK